MKTVIFPINSFEYGGVLSLNRQYSRILKKQGYQTIIIGLRGPLQGNAFESDFSQVITVSNVGTFKLFHILRYRAALKKLIVSNHETYLHFSTNEPFLVAMSISSLWKCTKISAVYGFYFLEKISQSAKWYRVVLDWCLQWLQLVVAKKITVLTPYSEKMIKNHFPKINNKKIITIPASLTKLPSMTKSSLHHKKLSIFNYGRAEERKNIDSLLIAFAKLRKKYPNAILTIASTVKYYKYTNLLDVYEQHNLFDSVRLLHSVNDQQVEYLFDQSDVFVMPSKELETFGVTMLTALSKGVPVIGTPVGSIFDVLSLVDKRLLCDDASPNAIYKSLLWYAKLSVKERKSLGNKSRLAVKKYFVDNKYEKLICELYD